MYEATRYMLKIDPEFKNLIPPLLPEERAGLEKSLLEEGCRDSIVVWNETIIDGHNRYELCNKHFIDFGIVDMKFDNRDDVIEWIYQNQLSRRNLTDEKRTYLIGKQSEHRKKKVGAPEGNQNAEKQCRQNVHIDLKRTIEKIAQENNVSSKYVQRAEQYSKSVDNIAENLGNETKEKILSGGIKANKKDIIELSKLEPKKQEVVFKKAVEDNIDVKTAMKESEREERREELKQKTITVESLPETITLHHGDFLKEYKKLAPESVDCIITDPPYVREWLDNHEQFAIAAKHVLKPGGFLITYIGHIHMDKILKQMTPHLDYYWVMCLKHTGGTAAVHSRGVMCGMKPILIFQKSPRTMPKQYFNDFIEGTGREKDAHEWQQGEEEINKIFQSFTDPGDVVLDPFMGSGTTMSMAKKLDRIGIGFDIVLDNVEVVRGRLSE